MVNPYEEEVASFAGPKPTGPADNPYAADVADLVAQRQQRTRFVFEKALAVNPDQAAEASRLTNTTGLPLRVVESNLDAVRARQRARQLDLVRMMQDSPVLARQLMDPSFTKQAHDDLTTLQTIETGVGKAVRYMMGAAPGGGIVGDAQAGILNSAAALAGGKRAVVDTLEPFLRAATGDGNNYLARVSGDYAAQAKRWRDAAAARSPSAGDILGDGVSSGVQSFIQNAKYLPMALLGPLGAATALGGMVFESFGASYNKAADEGLPLWQSLGYASSDAAIEYWTEKIPMDALVGGLKANAPFIKILGNTLLREIPGEQIATILQDLNEWATINPGRPFADYLAERPNAAAQTLIATVIGTGGNVALTHSLARMTDAFVGDQWRADLVQDHADNLKQLLSTSLNAKLRERNPDEFRRLVQAMADGTEGAPTEVFVDAEQLAGLAPEVFNQLPQSVQDQMQEALASGDTVAIPIGDVLTLAPGTPLEQIITEHGRIGDPMAMSQFEAKAAGERAQKDIVEKAAQVIQQATDQQAMQDSHDRVRQGILDQLNTTKRFRRDVNEAYATWTAAFYTTMAGRLGITPEQMAAKYPLRIVDKTGAGKTLNAQGNQLDTPEFQNWFGDSKVVDEAGAPLVVYHGTDRNFAAFDRKAKPRMAIRLPGLYFTPSPQIASEFAGEGEGANVIPTYIRLENPVEVDMSRFRVDRSGRPGLEIYDDFDERSIGYLQEKLVDAMLSGNDGAIVRGWNDGSGDVQYVVFDPTQIKSAIGNSGAFSPDDANILNQSVSTRTPVPKAGREDPHLSTGLEVGLEALNEAPRFRSKLVEVVSKYITSKKSKAAEAKRLEAFVNQARDNLLWLYDQVPADTRERSKLWYVGGRNIVDRWVAKYDGRYTDAQMAAALAAMSPKMAWDTNVSLSERIVDIFTEQQNTPWSDAMTVVADKVAEKNEGRVSAIDEVRGKTLAELDSPLLKGMWIRFYDEAHNDRSYRLLTPEGGFTEEKAKVGKPGAEKDATAAYGNGFEPIAKVVSILQDGSIPNISRNLGEAHKVRNFYNNIFDPTDARSVTIDTHAVAAGLLLPLGASSAEVNDALGGAGSHDATGLSGTYALFAEAYRRAAAERGVLPREMQSITWEAVRGLFNPAFKTAYAKDKAAFNTLWKNYNSGKATLDETRQSILAIAGNIDPPRWVGSRPGLHEGAWASSYKADVLGPELPRGSAGSAAAGTGATDAPGTAQGAVDGRPLEQAGNGGGRYSSGGLAPLPGAPEITGATGPDPRLVAVAEQYAASRGITLKRQAEYASVDPARAARIAAAYEAMQHAPNDPAVKEAYANLIQQTVDQYKALADAGYKFWFMDPAADPYQGNPWNAMRDLRANQAMAVFPTEAGFGTGGQVNIGLADPKGGHNLEPSVVLKALAEVGAEVQASMVASSDTEPTLVIKVKQALTKEQGDRLSEALGQEAIAQRTDDEKGSLFGPMADKWGPFNPEHFVTDTGARGNEVANPLLADTGITWPYGSPDGELRPVLANDLFRAVHDAFGHGLEGAGFRAQGEENAWQAHSRLFTGSALGAITSETRGQNSWLNYGPHGEANRTAKVEDTVFADQKTGLMPEWTWTEGRVADASAVLEQPARGTFNPKNLELALNENADLSTFFHETGHFFLEVMADLSNRADAPVEVREDMDKILQWFGVKDLATWQGYTLDQKRPYHERFAESIEQYILEGKAPSVELQPAFRRFKSWMLSVYRDLKRFIATRADVQGIQLSDDVRKVFDRMLASEEQIKQAEEVAGLLPDENATPDAVEKLTARSIRDLKWASDARSKMIKALQATAAKLRKETEAEVRAEVDEMPEFLAKAALDKLREATPEYKDALKDWGDRREAAKERAAEEVKAELLAANPDVKALAKGQLLAKNKKTLANQAEARVIEWEKANPKPVKPVPPDADAQMESIAAKYEFTSVDEMLQAIDMAGDKASMIEGLTDQRMLERHGDLIDQRAIEEAATAAVHNEARAKSLATELSAQAEMLNPRQDTGKTVKSGKNKGSKITVNAITQAAKIFAANIVARTTVGNLQKRARQHLAAEARAGQRWQESTKKADTQAAVKAKQDQVLHNAAAKAALEAKGEVDKMIDYLKKFDKESVRAKMPPDYIAQIDTLLDAVDLRRSTTGTDIERRASLRKWVDSQHALGLDPILPEGLLDDMGLTSYKEMTVDAITSLVDAVKNIEHLGRLKSKLLAAKDKREFDVIADEIAASIRDNGGKELPVQLEPDGRIKKFFKGAWVDHRKLNSLIYQMDGGKENGPFYRALVRSMNDAGASENVMLEKATEALAKIYAPIEALPGGVSGAKIFIPEIKNSLSRAGRLAVALNWGNAQNRQRVLDGDNWTEAQVQAILKTLTPVELRFVNDMWTHIDSYWPDVKAKQLRVSGVVEDKVEAEPFDLDLGGGVVVPMRGGYYPIKYDPDRSVRAEKNEAKETAMQILRGAIGRATTRRGHTKQRVDEVKGRPVKKDLSVITQHVNQVVHDLAWHEWFIDANRLMNDSRIVGAIRDHYGPEVHRSLQDTAEAIAVGDTMQQGEIDKLLMMMRANVTRSIMGVSLTTAMLQPFGLTQSMARVGVMPVLRGAGRWAGDAVRMENTVGWINGKSDFMRLRSKTFNRELREISQRVRGKSKLMQVADASLFFLMQKLQMVADVPTWIGAYEKALAGGVDESAAVALADEAVLATQGGGTTKDLSAVQRNMPFLTQFYSYFNTTMNLVVEKTATTDFKSPKAAAGWLGDMVLLTVIPAILPALVTYALKGGDDDDPEEWAKRLAGWQASYLLGMFVGLRELPTLWSPFDYGGPPAAKLINDGKRLVQQAGQGEIDDQAVLAVIGFLGTALGIPTTQMIRSYKGWLAWDEGDAPPTSILFGPPPRD